MRFVRQWLPWFFLALFGAEIVAILAPKKEGEFHVREFGRLPVLLDGRIQPIDSVALNSLRELRGTGDVPLEEVPSWKFWHHPKKLKSTEWLLEVMCRPEEADQRPIFLIHHPELLGELGLESKGVEKSGLRYYTYKQLTPVRDELTSRAAQIQKASKEEKRDEKSWSTVEKQTVKVATALFRYERLKNSLRPEESDDPAAELKKFYEMAPVGVAEFLKKEANEQFDEKTLNAFAVPLQEYFMVANNALPLMVPPIHPAENRDGWVNVGAAILDSVRTEEKSPAVVWLEEIASAYRHNQPAQFNTAVAQYRQWLKNGDFAREERKGRAEFFYNDSKLFLHAMIIYLMAFLLAGGSLLLTSLNDEAAEGLRRSAYYLMILAGIVHTAGLIFRMVLEGRPPVTNLYSSAIFIGWGAMIFGLFLERVYRIGLGTAVGSVAGFVTLIIAHNLALGGDTMEMLRAVLDTNFWLATHVVVVTLGYASTFVAGLLGIAYVLLGLVTPVLARSVSTTRSASQHDVGKALTKMAYAIICFATLFSFVGTILGGIWADQSWGRFWGWDPKENGALIIVIWNALILHARWGGMVRERGLMNMAIFGNIVTSFSWFGVNMLGIGLHSYGFMDAASKWLILFVVSQVLLILLGLIPLQYWRSFRSRARTNPPSGGVGAGVAPAGSPG